MTQENNKTGGALTEDQGRQGKGQSNPGGFDQQSSSSMEREQEEQSRRSDQQRQQSQREQDRNGNSDE